MKQWLIIAGVSVALTACGGDDKKEAAAPEAKKANVVAQKEVVKTPVAIDPFKMKTLSEEAKVAVQSLGSSLQGALRKSMKSGGPVKALDVYHTSAPEFAGAVSAEKSMQVSRVSLKSRNSETGKPTLWQTKVLEEFESRKAGGEKSLALTYSEVVEHGGQQEFRFMKAIPTGKLCLTCHGAKISPAVQNKLTELYPHDKATGYKEGDLLGAFVVVKNLN